MYNKIRNSCFLFKSLPLLSIKNLSERWEIGLWERSPIFCFPASVSSDRILSPVFSPSSPAKDGWLLSPRRSFLHAMAAYSGICFPFSSIYAPLYVTGQSSLFLLLVDRSFPWQGFFIFELTSIIKDDCSHRTSPTMDRLIVDDFILLWSVDPVGVWVSLKLARVELPFHRPQLSAEFCCRILAFGGWKSTIDLTRAYASLVERLRGGWRVPFSSTVYPMDKRP